MYSLDESSLNHLKIEHFFTVKVEYMKFAFSCFINKQEKKEIKNIKLITRL